MGNVWIVTVLVFPLSCDCLLVHFTMVQRYLSYLIFMVQNVGQERGSNAAPRLVVWTSFRALPKRLAVSVPPFLLVCSPCVIWFTTNIIESYNTTTDALISCVVQHLKACCKSIQVL